MAFSLQTFWCFVSSILTPARGQILSWILRTDRLSWRRVKKYPLLYKNPMRRLTNSIYLAIIPMSLGYSQAVRHLVLVQASEVRSLVPQP